MKIPQRDILNDVLLNKSISAAETRRKTIHYLPLTKLANECGVPTTCNESRLPYQDEGTQNCSRKRADTMTPCNCCITQRQILNFHGTNHLVMDVTIGHTYSMQHDVNPNTWREMELGKCWKISKTPLTTLNVCPSHKLFGRMRTRPSTISIKLC